MNQAVWKEFSGITVLVAGDFMIDRYIEGKVSRISPEAPVPVVAVQTVREMLGGAGNVIHNILALGGHAKAVTCLGMDTEGTRIVELLRSQGADTEGILRDTSVVTIQKTRVLASHQQFLRYDQEKLAPLPTTKLETLRRQEDRLFSGVEIVILSDYGKGFLTEDCAQFLIGAAKKRGLQVVVDPKGTNYRRYRGATLCTPNLKELREVSGFAAETEDDLFAAAERVRLENELANIIVTRSEQGMSLIPGTSDVKDDFPAVAKEVSDVTGAGDTVVSVLALGMARNLSLPDCCLLANQAASVVVSKYGAAVVTPEELMLATVQDGKHIPFTQAAELARELHRRGRKIVFTNGCFDLVHAGHLSSFRQARALGDVLIVGLNADRSVRRLKGETRPIVNQENRAELLGALKMIDYVVIFDEDTPQSLIEAIRPDVLVKGRDWESKQPIAGQRFVESYGGHVEFIDLEQGLSTTAIVRKIQNS